MKKIPEITLCFWVIKILATTLGETAGDAFSMSMNWGYALSTLLFFSLFVVTVTAQIAVKKLHVFLYWGVIVATTTAGTTMADFADRSLGIGYMGGSLILTGLLAASLIIWKQTEGSVSIDTIASPRAEFFYWITILFSNTLGTALGDYFADSSGLGYEGGALLFASLIAVIAAGYHWTGYSRTALFWLAFILTRPLGATVGDFLTKTQDKGGLDFSRWTSSAVIMVLMVAFIVSTGLKPSVSEEKTG